MLDAHDPTDLFRFWDCSDDRDFIRVEWTDENGLLQTSVGYLDEVHGDSVQWIYDVPPDEVPELALRVILDAGEYGVDGARFAGRETRAEMEAAIAANFAGAEASAGYEGSLAQVA